MKKQLPPSSLTSKILGKSLLLAQSTLEQAIGYTSAYNFTGEYQNQKVQGRGYLEYIDVENQNAFKD